MAQCPNNCGNAAELHPNYGVIPCATCQSKPHLNLNQSAEFTTEDIKLQRRYFKDDIIQPFRKGELSKEYIDKYGTKNLKVTDEEIKNAKYIWNGTDIKYYND